MKMLEYELLPSLLDNEVCTFYYANVHNQGDQISQVSLHIIATAAQHISMY